MTDWTGLCGGLFGNIYSAPTHTDAALMQQANAEAFRRIHESWRAAPPPTLEQAAEAARSAQNAIHRDHAAEATYEKVSQARAYAAEPNWTFWYWLAGLATAACVWRLIYLSL